MTNWQTRTIGELVEYEQPSKYLVKDTNYIEDGTPVLTANKAFVLGYTHEIEGIYVASKDSPVIIFDDFTTDNKFVDFDFKVKSSAIKILTARPGKALPRFVHGAMQLIKTEITEHKRRFISEYQFHPIDTPELAEQERIVGVLEVWDEYIEKLEQKIALKVQLKKGLMQQLLTGKRRLPGFSDGWQMTTVGSLGRIVSGGTPDTSKSEYWGGEIDWITPTEITKIKRLINKPTKKRITNAGLRASSTFVLPPSSLVLCSRATIGECAINETEITTNQGFKNIIPNRKVDVWYLYYWIKQNKKLLLRISSGSTFLEYSKKDLERLKINLPGLDEQLCVARVLKNIDKQIENYEAKKILIESQKKYLLKNLITGTIRTPEDLQPLDTSRLERSAL